MRNEDTIYEIQLHDEPNVETTRQGVSNDNANYARWKKRQTMFLMNEILSGKTRSLSRETKTIRKNQMEILEIKNTISENPGI